MPCVSPPLVVSNIPPHCLSLSLSRSPPALILSHPSPIWSFDVICVSVAGDVVVFCFCRVCECVCAWSECERECVSGLTDDPWGGNWEAQEKPRVLQGRAEAFTETRFLAAVSLFLFPAVLYPLRLLPPVPRVEDLALDCQSSILSCPLTLCRYHSSVLSSAPSLSLSCPVPWGKAVEAG